MHVRDMQAQPAHTFIVKPASVGGHVGVEGAADVMLGTGKPALRVHVDNVQLLMLSRFVMDLALAAERVVDTV